MWRKLKLGDICNISIGKTPSRSDKRYWDKDKQTENVWLSIADLTAVNGRYIGDSKEYISEEGARLFKPVPKNTLVMSFKLSIGKLAFTQCELRTNEAIAALPIKDETVLSKEYLYHYLSSLNWDDIAGNDEKVKGKTLNKKKLSELAVTIPPLAEQQRIVTKLDAAFAEIDRIQSVFEEKLSDYSSMRLKAYQIIINKHCSNKNQYKLSEIVDESCSLSYGIVQPGDDVADGLPVVRPVDLKSKWIGKSDLKRIASDRAGSYQRTKLSGGEVLLCVRGSTGTVSLASDELNGANVTRGIIPIRFSNSINNEYGYYALQSDSAQKQIADKTYGATLQQINVKDVKNLLIDVPKLEEQLHAVAEIVEADNCLNALLSITLQQIENTKQLKSAILAQELQPSEAA